MCSLTGTLQISEGRWIYLQLVYALYHVVLLTNFTKHSLYQDRATIT